MTKFVIVAVELLVSMAAITTMFRLLVLRPLPVGARPERSPFLGGLQ